MITIKKLFPHLGYALRTFAIAFSIIAAITGSYFLFGLLGVIGCVTLLALLFMFVIIATTKPIDY